MLIKIISGIWALHDRKNLAGQKVPENIIEMNNVPYKSGTNFHEKNVLDICYPKDSRKPLPVIINIHGGGFIYGHKGLNRVFCMHMASKGFLVFNLDYRLVGKQTGNPSASSKTRIKLHHQIHDIRSALNWIERNIHSYPADNSRVYMTGESAGAYLAAMAVLVSKNERLQKLFYVKNAGVHDAAAHNVDADNAAAGAQDAAAHNAADSGFSMKAPDIKTIAMISGFFDWPGHFLYGPLRSIILEKGYKKMAYYNDLFLDEIPEIVDLPPIFLTTNADDPLKAMTFSFAEFLKQKNHPHRFVYLPKIKGKKLGHVFNIFHLDWEESIYVNSKMLDFFSKEN